MVRRARGVDHVGDCGPGQAESGTAGPSTWGTIMVMKWELTKTALWFASALLAVYAVVSVLELMAQHH